MTRLTDEEIIKGNEVIEKFYGSSARYGYHDSWDDLMPVVEKIAKLKYPVSIYISHIQCSSSIQSMDGKYSIIRESNVRTTALIETFKMTVETIQWLNLKK
jgi:hypothetical protein